MFGTIRRHQKWLWLVIITLTIISFVLFFSPYSKVNSGRGSANFGTMNGHRITEEQFVNAQREVYLRYFFMTGNWPDQDAKRTGFDPQRETYQWLLVIQKQEQMGVHVGSDVAAQVGREMIHSLERMNVRSADMFFNDLLKPRGFQPEDFERYLRHDLGLRGLMSVVGLSGKLVTPDEARALYVREHEELDTEAVFFNPSNYVANVSVTPEAIASFYSNRLANFRIPEQVQVSYVTFGISNLLAQAEADWQKTNFNEVVEMNFQRIGTNYFKDAKTPEEAKAKIREELIRTRALSEARKKAIEFARPLFDMTPPRPENLEILAKSNGLPVEVSLPFDRDYGPTNIDVGAEFVKSAFSRTAEEPFGGPIVGKDGAYVIALKQRLPSRIPSLDEVREKVTADYKMAQAMNLARQAGTSFYQTLTNGLAQGKTFEAVCMEAKVPLVTVPRFSLSTRELPQFEGQIALNQLKQIAFSTPPGKASEFQMTGEGGLIVYVKAKIPADETKMKSELASFVKYVRQKRQEEAFNDWFRKEAERGLSDIPALRQQTPPTMKGAPTAKS
jgi:hypothetical protein